MTEPKPLSAEEIAEIRNGDDPVSENPGVHTLITVKRRLLASLSERDKRIAELREALEEIAKAEGEFNRDPLQHASNTIANMQECARSALTEGEKS